MLTKVDHVGFAVHNLDEAIELYTRVWGLTLQNRERLPDHGVDEAMFRLGDSYIQLLGSLSPASPIGKFLERRGEGLHHIAYTVTDIEAALDSLASSGVKLIDAHPRAGGRNTLVAFVHPKDNLGVMVELVEYPSDGQVNGDEGPA